MGNIRKPSQGNLIEVDIKIVLKLNEQKCGIECYKSGAGGTSVVIFDVSRLMSLINVLLFINVFRPTTGKLILSQLWRTYV